MEIIKEILGMIGILVSLFWIVYVLAYAVELGKMKARRKLKVCDVCFEKAERIAEVDKQSKSSK